MAGVVEPVFIALGSNLGDRARHIRDAAGLLDASGDFAVTAIAPFYESAPMYVEDQPSFVNTCLMGRSFVSADCLLTVLKDVENKVGRQATYRNGPRVIDLDIVFFGAEILETADLTVPHPRRLERLFVLQPMADLAPDFIDPETGQTIAAHLARQPGPMLRRMETTR